MGALEAFWSTWSDANATFGQGVPQQGSEFDRSAQLRQAQSQVEAAAPGSRWTGAAADAYGAANAKQAQTLGQLASLDQRLGAEVDRSAAVVTAGRQNLETIKQWVTSAAASLPEGADRQLMETQIARKGIGDVADVVRQTNGDLKAVGARIQQIGNEYRILGGPKLGGPGDKEPGKPDDWVPPYDTGSDIPVGKSPEEVKKWWKALPDQRRNELLQRWPEKVGNLNGIPVVDRDKANRTIMERDLNRPAEVAKSRGVTVEEVMAHPEKYGMAGPMMDRYNNACKVHQALEDDSRNTGGAPTFLQVYEPEAFKGDGRAAIAIGDPDHAANTAVVVPGTGNSVGSGWLGGGDAVNLFNEANAADRTNHTAVLAWMGYDAPDSPVDPRIGATALAHQGGQLLASDVNALNVTHEGNGHMTVLGHSYGSTTVSDAAAGYGMHTDDVVLVGCPGTDMAHGAADFHLNDGGHLYVGAASSDPITRLGALPQAPIPGTGWSISLGDDPALDGYGSTRFKAEVPGLTSPLSDHSQYYKPGGESLFSMSDIVSGHGDALEHDGMTARHRIPGLSVLGDPETYRPGTSGHTHQ